MSKPNIFSIATKELSQDGFFTWLLQWADSSNTVYDLNLHEAAKECIKYFIQLQHDTSNLAVDTVRTWRQWEHIDIVAEVNQEFAIIIEDKTNSAEHSEQLERYKEIATKHYQEKGRKLAFIYLKTGNESSSKLKKVKEKGFAIADRKSVLNILNAYQVENAIFHEFKEHLTIIETETNSYNSFQNIISKWKAAEGFYICLQEKVDEWSDWGYVANQSGGFLCFCYHWNGTDDYSIYIQIENAFDNGIKLVIKIADWTPSTRLLYQMLSKLQPIALEHGLSLVKPDRYRAGETSTLAIVDNAFPVDNEGVLDIDKFVTTLKSLEKTIDEYCRLENEQASRQQVIAASGADE
ncbi:MAG: nuclease [Chitinophagaceae bacterium]|nr:MAG: nuclease [Chitinophagaceae bacterium]